jgi:hypothetical protein
MRVIRMFKLIWANPYVDEFLDLGLRYVIYWNLADKVKPFTNPEGYLWISWTRAESCPHFVVLASHHKGNG